MSKIIGVTVGTPQKPSDFANALKGSASGNPIVLSDVSPIQHEIKVKLSGSGSGGKNLFYFPQDINESLWDSAVIAQKGTSVMTVPVGEDIDNCLITINLDSFNLDVNKTYTLSIRGDYIGDSGLPATLNDVGFENAGEEYDWNCVYITFTPSQSNTIAIDVGEYYYGGDLKFLLEEGDSVTEYEDYIAGVDVNGAAVQKYGINLFDQETFFRNNGFELQGDGSWIGKRLFKPAFTLPVQIKGSMYIRLKGKNISASKPFYLTVNYVEGGQSTACTFTASMTKMEDFSFATLADKTVKNIYWNYSGTGGSDGVNGEYYIKDIIFSYADVPYEPYKGDKATVTTGGLVPTPIATYTADEEGNISIVGNGESMTLIAEDGVTMEAEYNVDTKKYIDKKFAELQALVLEV